MMWKLLQRTIPRTRSFAALVEPIRLSRLFIPTLNSAPSDATSTSQALLTQGGFIRLLSSGCYTMLPLALRVLRKLEDIVDEELQALRPELGVGVVEQARQVLVMMFIFSFVMIFICYKDVESKIS